MLAEGWDEFYSEKEKRPYWYNKELDQSVWVKPVQLGAFASSQFADQEIAETYATLGQRLKNKVDSIADQDEKEIYMRKIIDMRKSLNELKATEQAPPAPQPPAAADNGDQVVSAANVLEVEGERLEPEKQKGAEGQGQGETNSGESKIIKIA